MIFLYQILNIFPARIISNDSNAFVIQDNQYYKYSGTYYVEYDYEALRTRLANLKSHSGDKQIVATYLYEANYNSANTLLNLIPNLYDLEGEKLQDFNDYKDLLNLQINLKQQDRNVFTMSENEKSQLIALAENSNGEAKYGAQNILSFVYGENYCDCISPIEGGDNKSTFSSFEYSDEDIAKALGYNLTVKPNPARVYTSVDYNLPVGVEFAELQLINIEGKVVSTNKVSGTQGQITIDVRNYKTGSYIFRLFSNEYSISESLIIE